ncbi:unnamed protein product [Ectocarpus sp. 12 AP-2014]
MEQPARIAPPCLSLQADEYRPQCILLCVLQGSEGFLCVSHCRSTAPFTHRRPFPVDLAPPPPPPPLRLQAVNTAVMIERPEPPPTHVAVIVPVQQQQQQQQMGNAQGGFPSLPQQQQVCMYLHDRLVILRFGL